jgi:wyosine [tRNA(Phe)-imidazoG37] synthetase (radical SAM superfamily)
MLTKEDLEQITQIVRTIVREEIELESQKIRDELRAEISLSKMDVKQDIKELSNRMKNVELDIKKIHHDTKIIINFFEDEDRKIKERLGVVEKHVVLN